MDKEQQEFFALPKWRKIKEKCEKMNSNNEVDSLNEIN